MDTIHRGLRVIVVLVFACTLVAGMSFGAPRILVLLNSAITGAEEIQKGIGVILADAENATSNDYSVSTSIDGSWKVTVVDTTTEQISSVLETEYANTADPVVAIVCRGSVICTEIGDYLNSNHDDAQPLLISATGSSSNLKLSEYSNYMMLMYPQNVLQAQAIYQVLIDDMPERTESSSVDRYVIVYENDTFSSDLYYLLLVHHLSLGDKRAKGTSDPPVFLYNPLLAGTFSTSYLSTAEITSVLTSYALGANDAIVYLGNPSASGGGFEELYNAYTATNGNTRWYSGDTIAEKDISSITAKTADVKALAAAASGGSKSAADTAFGTGTASFVYYYGYDTGLFLKKMIEEMKVYSLESSDGATQLSLADYRNQVLNSSKTFTLSSEDTATGVKDFIHQGSEEATFQIFGLQDDESWSSIGTVDASQIFAPGS